MYESGSVSAFMQPRKPYLTLTKLGKCINMLIFFTVLNHGEQKFVSPAYKLCMSVQGNRTYLDTISALHVTF